MNFNQIVGLTDNVYGVPNDRLYEANDLLYFHQKYFFRYIEKMTEGDDQEARKMLAVSASWFISLVRRLHIDVERILSIRYSYKCPLCLDIPCSCERLNRRMGSRSGRPVSRTPISVDEWQKVILKIYGRAKPENANDTVSQMCEKLSFYFRLFQRDKLKTHFRDLEYIAVDYLVVMLRVYNSLQLSFENDFRDLYQDGCYVCHKIPCICNYYE